MNCGYLAGTGVQLMDFLILAFVCFAIATILFLRSRRGRTAAALALLLFLSGCLLTGVISGSTAHATDPRCPAPVPVENSISINQSVEIGGLAPGAAPQEISGVIMNKTTQKAFINSVTVSIISVSEVPHNAAGTCDVSDYFLLAPEMPVGRTLKPGESVAFSGASIGFNDKLTNQDACRGARVNLRYDGS